jgi:hypothetical protein
MQAMNRLIHSALAVAALAATGAVSAQEFERNSLDDTSWGSDRGFAFQLDNDLFSGAHRDQDYSWGAALTLASPRPRGIAGQLDRSRDHIESWFTTGDAGAAAFAPETHATQFGILAMTPSTLRSDEPLFGDRPFANLVFISAAQMRVLGDGSRARFSSLSVGALGLQAAEALMRGMHRAVGDELPQGWDHQISEGGEPTFRYMQAKQWLLGDPENRSSGRPELKFTASGSAGYLTEAGVALSGRWGRIQSPWWSFAPELGDYTAAPVAPVTRFNSNNPAEIFAFAGVRVKARAYNALLQGQFRHSDVRVSSDDLARLQGEAWMGVATTWSDLRITYALHYSSTEMLQEPGKRSLIWAGINFEKSL